MNIFNYLDYKLYLIDVISQYRGKRGFLKNLAEAAGCQASLISRVIHSELHLTPDHVPGISEFLKLNDLESEFLETLVHLARSGSPTYRKTLQRRLGVLKEKASDLSRVFESPEIASAEAQNFYYSSWPPSAIHIACAVKGLGTPRALAERLGLSQQEVLSVLERLKSLELVQENSGVYSITKKFLHISKDSFLVTAHHSNWRNQGIQNCQKKDQTNLHFTGIFAIGKNEFEKLKEQLQAALEQIKVTVNSTKNEEDLVCVTLDSFKVGY